MKYFASLDYTHEGDIYKKIDNGRGYETGFGYDRINVRSNLDFTITNSTTLRVNLSGSHGVTKGTNFFAYENLVWPPSTGFRPICSDLVTATARADTTIPTPREQPPTRCWTKRERDGTNLTTSYIPTLPCDKTWVSCSKDSRYRECSRMTAVSGVGTGVDDITTGKMTPRNGLTGNWRNVHQRDLRQATSSTTRTTTRG